MKQPNATDNITAVTVLSHEPTAVAAEMSRLRTLYPGASLRQVSRAGFVRILIER